MLPKLPARRESSGGKSAGPSRASISYGDSAGISTPGVLRNSKSTGSVFRDVRVELSSGEGAFDTRETLKHVVFPRLDDAARARGLASAHRVGWEADVSPPSSSAQRPSVGEAASAKAKLDSMFLIGALDHHARAQAAYLAGPRKSSRHRGSKPSKKSKARPPVADVSSSLVENLARIEVMEHKVCIIWNSIYDASYVAMATFALGTATLFVANI